MNERQREAYFVAAALAILVVTWFGFFVHRSPRFPGSGVGAAFGIAAAVLMLLPLAYSFRKRVNTAPSGTNRQPALQTLLKLHIFAGLLGPFLAIMHTGHKFDSWLGIVLVGAMLLVVISGVVVRYLLAYVGHEIKDKLALLQTARGDLDNAWGELERDGAEHQSRPKRSAWPAAMSRIGVEGQPAGSESDVVRIAEAVAELEFSVRMHEVLKTWFARSLKLHIALATVFYVLLVLHIVAGVQFGLRWLA